ncbi:hypothetical protein J7M28_00760 [bacterium]|nr:hypothetical protein [bacterium]
MKRQSHLVFLLICLIASASCDSFAGESPPAKMDLTAQKEAEIKKKSFPIHGSYFIRYRLRFADGEWELLNYSQLSLDLGDPERHKVTGHVFSLSTSSLGERRDDGARMPAGIDDTYHISREFHHRGKTYEARSRSRLGYCYIDIHRLGFVKKIRLGRQLVYETPEPAHFDGALVTTERIRSLKSLEFTFYGGLPIHSFEASRTGDFLAGLFTNIRPWTGGKVQTSFARVEDELESGKREDNHLALSIWQRFDLGLGLHLQYERLNDNDGDLLFRANYEAPVADFGVNASYYQLFETKREFSTEFDPCFSSLRELYSYWQARFAAHKGWTEHFLAEAGFELRQLRRKRDESTYNHEFKRYFTILSLFDLPIEDLTFSLNGDLWDSEAKSGDNWTIGGDLDYEVGRKFKVSLGSAYSLFEYDYFSDMERDDVRTYYVKLRFRPVKVLTLGLRYDLEDDDFEIYHRVQADLKVAF